MFRTVVIGLFMIGFTALSAQDPALWLRYPAISPDGQTIVFSYRGDLYRVPASGGMAIPLTVHEGRDFMPVWSPDGTKIAFASDRFGQFDVFVMPSTGGAATRLTFHSSGEFPKDFTPDGKEVIYAASLLDAASNQQFPSGVLPELYRIPVQGGMPRQLLTTPAINARFNAAGTLLVFHDRKGYEDEFRKHHTSSVARDIWSYDLQSARYRQLTTHPAEDRNPVVTPDQRGVYFLSERSGTFNVWKMDLEGRNETMITRLDKHPVRYLTMSRDGLLCFSWDGEIHTMREGESPRKVTVTTIQDLPDNTERIIPAQGGITELAVSPNGKELAYVFRGEIFAASVKEGTTRRITDSPEQERSVSFSPDGRTLLYAGERDGSWNVYQTRLARDEEKYFFNATVLEEKPVVATTADEFQPSWSPDGKEVAFLENRTTLRVIRPESGQVRTVLPPDHNYSYADGDQFYEWSPDGKWFLVEFLQPRQWISEVGLVSAEGGKPVVNLSESGYSDAVPQWIMGGKGVMWYSDRDGMKNHASWGSQADVYAMIFTREAWDRFRLSKEEFDLLKEEEDKAKEKDKEKGEDKKEDASGGKSKKKKDEDEVKKPEPLVFDWEDMQDRKRRLTIHSADLAGAVLSADGEKLYYLAQFEKGWDLWQTELRTHETKILAKLGAESAGDLQMDKEGKALFLLADGAVTRIETEGGKRESIATKGEMVLRASQERAYLYDHIVRQVAEKFYVTDLHGVDWAGYTRHYRRFLPHIHNDYDFAEMLSELLGELNASHTGARYWSNAPQGDRTASLGLYYDDAHTGPGLKIAEVMAKSPVIVKDSRIKAGVVIEAMDGVAIAAGTNPHALLNRREGRPLRLSLYDPSSQSRWEEVVKPISQGEENELVYQRWVNRCRHLVDSLSGGRIGYVHVRGMNDPSYRVAYADALGKHAGKEALVVDTRFNGGGWLHDDLVTFLNGKTYLTFMPRGQDLGQEPQFKWRRPSVVVMSESNYSDAHMFPFTYKALGVGKLVGMPVPGTGTAVWWERLQSGVIFGIPQVGMVGLDGQYLENQELQPDIRVANDPGEVRKGRDQQLEAAVRELLGQIGG